jgi:subtilisin family serine protease
VVSSIRTNRVGTTDVVQSKAIVRAAEVHQAGFEGQGTYVAVLDTGVDTTGYEGFFPADSIAGSYRARDVEEGDADGSATPEGHGTHVSSTVLAMAPRTRILSIEVFKMTYYWDEGLQYDALWSDGRLKDGIRHIFDLKRTYLADPTACCNIVAMNLSLGIDGTRNETACADEYGFALARELGIIPVVSAGNSAQAEDPSNPGRTRFLPGVGYLACNIHALNVGATTDGVFPEFSPADTDEYCGQSDAIDEPAGFSQTGLLLDILAPGNCIVAARGAFQGTSMAAPHVAGAVAALVSAKPDSATSEIIGALTDSGTPIEDTRTTPSTTRNRLDMAEAVAALRGVDTPTPTAGPLLGRIIAVSLEPDEIAPEEALRSGARYQLDPFGVWNRGTLTTQYQLLVVDSGLGLTAPAPAEWFTLDPVSVTLDPGQVALVRPVLEIPAGASPGAYASTIRAVSPIDGGLTDSILVTFQVSGATGSGGGGLGAADSAGLPIGPVIVVGLLAIGLIAWLWRRGQRSA